MFTQSYLYHLLYVCYDFTYEELGSVVCVVAVAKEAVVQSTSWLSQSVFRENVPVASWFLCKMDRRTYHQLDY